MKKITRKIKFFFDTLVKSLTKFEYYKEIEKAKFSFSLKYLAVLFFIIAFIESLIFALSIGILLVPKIPGYISQFESKADTLYPQGLVVTVKKGSVTTNEKEPFYIDSLNQFGIVKGYSHFITIDTNADPSNIKNEDTVILITKSSVVTVDNNNTYQVYPIDQTTNAVINQTGYREFISKILPYLKYVEPGLISLIVLSVIFWPFIGGFLALSGQLLYLLIFALIILLVTKIMKKKLEYKKIFQLLMHACTLPILLTLVVSALGIQMPFLLGSAILLIFMILVLNQF